MQGISISTFVAPGHGGQYGALSLFKADAKFMDKVHLCDGVGGKMSRLFLVSPCASSGRDMRVRSMWLFDKGGDGGMDANCERSETANEDILMFFFQLDLSTRIQYALNMEQYDVAKQLRNKLTEVEAEVDKQEEAKMGSKARSEAQDNALKILRLRADLQKAISNEDYASAAGLRDEISTLEAESLVMSAKALTYENIRYLFRLGQRVKHKLFGYQAVICGMDPVCCESTSWMQTANVGKLHRGPNQPFYQVLVDVHADPNLLVAYVAEENLMVVNQPDMDRFDHPYISFLFYGMDTAGDFIPIKQLREKCNMPRHEVPLDSHDEGEEKKS